jgi:hypothetical protein
MKTTEARLKENVKVILDALGAYYYMPVPTGYGATTLDFLCCIDGIFVAIETKSPGNKPTRLQEVKLELVQKAGGIAIWGDNIDSIIKQLQAHNFNLA